MNQKQVDTWIAAGVGRRLHVGDGLYLSRNGVKGDKFSWAYIWTENGKRREKGLGAYTDEFKLREARWSTSGIGKMRDEGKDVIRELRQEKRAAEVEAATFSDVAAMYLRDVGLRKWKGGENSIRAKEFDRVLKTYCKSLLSLPVADVNVADVKKVLDPWVKSRPTMVQAVASIIRRVLDTAMAHELRPLGVNPASDDVLSKVLVVRHETRHYASMSWQKVPDFYKSLNDCGDDYRVRERSVIRKALQLLILTALRKNEITGLRWSEVDLETCMLTIDAERMKSGKAHIVPLSRQACELVRSMQPSRLTATGAGRANDGFVFPSPRRRNYAGAEASIGPGAFEAVLNARKGPKLTVHGFRATFRTWAEDHGVDDNLAEHALAHTVHGSVAKAYRRSTAVELRRSLMQDWADYVTPANL